MERLLEEFFGPASRKPVTEPLEEIRTFAAHCPAAISSKVFSYACQQIGWRRAAATLSLPLLAWVDSSE